MNGMFCVSTSVAMVTACRTRLARAKPWSEASQVYVIFQKGASLWKRQRPSAIEWASTFNCVEAVVVKNPSGLDIFLIDKRIQKVFAPPPTQSSQWKQGSSAGSCGA
jgi:hypothetical protein